MSTDSQTTTTVDLRLNVGAGQERLEGYIAIDGYIGPDRPDFFQARPDIVAMAWDLDQHYLPGSVNEIRCHHAFEHISIPLVDRTLRCWHRILKIDGLLDLVVPDFGACVKAILGLMDEEAKEIHYRHIFGSQFGPGEFHCNGFTQTRLTYLLTDYGFDVSLIQSQPVLRARTSTFDYPTNPPLSDLFVLAYNTDRPVAERRGHYTHNTGAAMMVQGFMGL